MVFPNKFISIDIGAEHIKIADIIRKREKVVIKHGVIVKTPDNAINDGKLIDKNKLANVIGQAIKKHQIKTKNVVFSVSSTKIITREVEFPKVNKNKLKTMIEVNSGEYFPVNLDDYILDYTIIDTFEIDKKKQYKVLLVAALNTIVEDYVELTELIGLKLRGIDYAGNSLANFIKYEHLEGTYMFIDLGSETTKIAVVSDNQVELSRNIPYGTYALADHVSNHRNIDYESACQLLCKEELLTIVEDENPYLSNNVSSTLNQLLNGVSRLLDFYTSRHPNKNIRYIYLLGGGSKICGIEDYIENFFNIKTKTFEQMNKLVNKEKQSLEINRYFHISIGAAYSNVNLLPLSIMKASKSKNTIRLTIEICILVALSITLFMTYKLKEINDMEKEKIQLTGEIEAAKEIQVLNETNKQLSERLTFLEGIMDASDNTSLKLLTIIEDIEEVIPEDVFFLSMNHSNEQIMFNCIAKDKMTVAKFIQSIKMLHHFSSVYVPSIIEAKDEDDEVFFTFTLQCVYIKGE